MVDCFLYPFSIPPVVSIACTIVNNKSEVWHKLLGHPNSFVLSHLNNIDKISSHIDCFTCKLGKSKSLSVSSHDSRAERSFDLIHSDMWSISPIISHANYKYLVTFIDDYSKFTYTYFLHSKSEVFSIFQQFVVYIKTRFSLGIKVLRSNLGGEYMSREFYDFLHQKGIIS